MSDETGDPLGSGLVGRVAGPGESLPLEDAEPDLDLIEPRGMEGQELEPDAAILGGDPSPHVGRCVDREIVQDYDQAAAWTRRRRRTRATTQPVRTSCR